MDFYLRIQKFGQYQLEPFYIRIQHCAQIFGARTTYSSDTYDT